MAAPRATVVQSLSIALIVFVMLTFVLAVTTYLFFRQKFDAEAAAQAAATEMAQAKTALQTAEGEKNKLKEILGFSEDKAVADIETEVNELFEKNHEDFNKDSKSYRSFSEWLLESNDAKDKTINALTAKSAQFEKEKEDAIAAAAKQRADLEAQARKKEQEAADLKKDFDARWEEHASRSKSLTEEQQKALDRAGRLDLLDQEIAKGESLLSAPRQARFKTQPPEGRVAILFEELRDREKLIVRQNEILGDLRVADKKLQDTVLAATPADDRVDGLDGRILSINEVDRTVLVDVGSTRGLRPGLVMRVYEPGDARPQAGDFKAVVEVVAVESDALARARIRSDAVGDPILPGDRVATSLWSPDGTFEAVIVGFVQLDADQKADQDRLQELIEQIGGRVEPAVSTATTMVIDAGLPQSPGGVLERAAGWRAADESRRDKQTKEARRLGIRVVNVDGFLEMMGLDRSALDSNRLPRVGRGQAPAVPGGVAY
ncbi:MAG: BRCT domain-containing protein [Planctomycetia bacterium]